MSAAAAFKRLCLQAGQASLTQLVTTALGKALRTACSTTQSAARAQHAARAAAQSVWLLELAQPTLHTVGQTTDHLCAACLLLQHVLDVLGQLRVAVLVHHLHGRRAIWK